MLVSLLAPKYFAQLIPEELQVSYWSIALIFLTLIFSLLFLLAFLWLGWWVTNRHGSSCPYTQQPLKRGVDLAFSEVKLINDYLEKISSIENAPYELKRCSVCPVTGRIFPDSVTIFEVIKVNWSFLKQRWAGHWVSYGSLTELQKKQLKLFHPSMKGFQTKFSSPNPKPQDVEEEYALKSPGPLYVDLATQTLIGWKRIPGTIWEVLVIQPPHDEVRGAYDDIAVAKKKQPFK